MIEGVNTMADMTSMAGGSDPTHSPSEIAAAWQRERPGTPTGSIEIVTPIWRLAKLFSDDRVRVLRAAGIDAATLDLLSVIRRSGPPYALSTRELTRRTLVTAGAISQRVARAEREGLVRRAPGTTGRRTVMVSLTDEGHSLIERSVDAVLGREAMLVSGLSDSERDLLAGLLEKLTADVGRRLTDSR
ncbi:MarR family winged helix-turn-helix transcriptional regulator [Streptosporangium sandarakinum]|uniref:DNA-binding MarR family transcriptional regulator n=2 Tax=Streptosporangium TaxID=2000 RepID=A0A852V1F8_9ACTN|nr:MarR family transcriptional regulator [Streptosporangium sandarakinum]NYF39645.1 DNA-binding MarR family transcriptional regulator [Streptosporangium sandarakinum]